MNELIEYHRKKLKYYQEALLEFRNSRSVAKVGNVEYYNAQVRKWLQWAKKHRIWIKQLEGLK